MTNRKLLALAALAGLLAAGCAKKDNTAADTTGTAAMTDTSAMGAGTAGSLGVTDTTAGAVAVDSTGATMRDTAASMGDTIKR